MILRRKEVTKIFWKRLILFEFYFPSYESNEMAVMNLFS